MTREGQEMTPVMHKFMDVMAGNQRRRALLGAYKIDEQERENSGEYGPRQNLAEWDWNRPGCRSLDKVAHVLPYSHLRVPLGSRVSRRRDAGKPHPRGRRTVCQRGESVGGVCYLSHGVTDEAMVSPDGRSLDDFHLARPSADEAQLNLCGDSTFHAISLIHPKAASALLELLTEDVMANFVDVSTDTKTIAGEALAYPSTPNPVISSNVVTIPPGMVTPWMVHPVQCYIYVLEGVLTVEFSADGSLHKCNAGQAFLQTRTHWHRGRNDGTTPVSFLGVFIGAKDVPTMLHPPSGKLVQG
jgi:quercetin dioxygenase-like cupin family protein